MKVIGYVRVSSDEQAKEGHSLGAQRAKLEQYASLYDLEIVEIVEDAGVSAKSIDRPGLARVLGALSDGRAQGVLIAKLDRLTRSVKDLGSLLEKYFEQKFSLLSVADQIDTGTAGGRLVLNVLTSVAQWERETGAERTAAALQHLKSQGYHVGAPGFGSKMVEKRLVEVDEELAIIDRIIAERHEGGTWRSIADALNRDQVPTKRGGAWQPTTARNLYLRHKVA